MSNWTRRARFHPGDRVQTLSAEEILSTLDDAGTLDGLPFMPEMLDWCGRSFRVERRAEKTCVDVPPPVHPNRRFPGDDVVFLEDLRCDGNAHDGCSRGCKVYWKEAWLRPDDGVATATDSEVGRSELLARLKTKADETRYFCQSTQLFDATEELPGSKKLWRLRIAVREIRNGDRSVPEILRFFALWVSEKFLRVVNRDERLRGPHEQAPVSSLGLKVGERVRIKSRTEVEATLDRRRTNRGLRVCHEMTRCCGAEAEVRARVDRVIDERTGEMRTLSNTVTLRNVRTKRGTMPDSQCLCWNEPGDCPRGELMFWREIWLERAPAREHEHARQDS